VRIPFPSQTQAANSTRTFFPSAIAARSIVSKVTEGLDPAYS